MEWFCHDPELGADRKWWSIDPQTGAPSDAANSDHCLGDPPLDAIGMSADAIESLFGASRFWSDDELRALLLERIVPAPIHHASDAAELLELVDLRWQGASICYETALHRLPTPTERHWLFSHAFAALRKRKS